MLSYDPLGRLWQVSNTSTTTRFLYDGDAMVAEYSAAGTLLRRHAHWPGADVPMVSYAGTDLSQPTQLLPDERGSIVTLANASGGLTGINTYDEYGIPGAANSGRFQYTGQIWLAELGMYYYKARIYSPTLGRFMQTDPIGYDDQFNLYGYVGNDPINSTDPDGRQILDNHERDSEGLSRWKQQARDAMMEGSRQAAIAGYNLIASLYFAPIGGGSETTAAIGRAGFVASRSALSAAERAGVGGITRPMNTAINTVRNILHNNGKVTDFVGAAREARGIQTGFDHVTEMSNSIRGLTNSMRSLTGSLRNPNLAPEVRASLQAWRNAAQVTIRQMRKMLER